MWQIKTLLVAVSKQIGGQIINYLRYPDDVSLPVVKEDKIGDMIWTLQLQGEKIGLYLNKKKKNNVHHRIDKFWLDEQSWRSLTVSYFSARSFNIF